MRPAGPAPMTAMDGVAMIVLLTTSEIDVIADV
jgi:hypothetical protein